MKKTASILESDSVVKLERLIEEATRSTKEGVSRFVEPASGTLSRATSRQHHLVFGRRGSGKSSLLRKATSDLTIDRRPIAFVDLETFKGHAYPDVLLSVLIETFSEFAKWLDTAATAPAGKNSFWSRLFGAKPTRRPFNKGNSKELAKELRAAERDLKKLLYSEDNIATEAKVSERNKFESTANAKSAIKSTALKVQLSGGVSAGAENDRELTQKFVIDKSQYLLRHIMDYQQIFRKMADLSGGDSFLFLDDLYHIRRKDQAQVIDYFHRIGKGNRLWLKIGTIRHRTQWYVNGDPPVGAKIGDDIQEIDLDQTLERYASTKAFLTRVLDTFSKECDLDRRDVLADGAFDRLVLASGGVTRDFLGIFLRSVSVARDRGNTARGMKVGVEDVNSASGGYDSSKREELRRDTLDESQQLDDEFLRIASFVKDDANANVFLVGQDLPDSDLEPIEELVDLRLIHRVKSGVTVRDRPGKKYEAFMLDVSQYTASRKKRDFEIIEFWRSDTADSIRRTKLIYKEVKPKSKQSGIEVDIPSNGGPPKKRRS